MAAWLVDFLWSLSRPNHSQVAAGVQIIGSVVYSGWWVVRPWCRLHFVAERGLWVIKDISLSH